MKKIVIIMFIILSNVVGCSNQESKKVENKEVSTTTNEDAKFWKITTSSFQIGNENYELLGEVGKYGLLSKPFVVEKEDTYTLYLWNEDKDKFNEMIGKKVELFGISEQSEEKHLLTTTTIEKLNNNNPEAPDSDLTLKFDAVLGLPIKGKWKVESYVDENLLDATILFVEG